MSELHLARWRERIDAALALALPDPTAFPQRLHAAMRHAVLLGGKRMRPLLVHAAGALFDAKPDALDAPAVAIELIHAYSLVHDDLPAMDDDELRRGQPTVHVAFDEATAILAGDALQSLAFAVLAETRVGDAVRVELLRTLAVASGSAGMCGGQALDLAATGHAGTLTIAELERLHALKTGALIRAAVRMGALCGG
ncbi:MAG TPA: polyprenyl synthetase family protein, partial [Lysobacter sp.]|nr:polyprenyl synthetase family protein [Lysobacter sp.]